MHIKSTPHPHLYLFVPDNVGAHPSFSDFIDACAVLKKTLAEVNRCLNPTVESLQFEVSGLASSSAKVDLEPMIDDRNAEEILAAKEVLIIHSDTIFTFARGRTAIDPRLDYRAIESFAGFEKILKRGRVGLSLNNNSIGAEFFAAIRGLLEPYPPCYSAVSGTIEKLNVHGRNTFVLFPSIPGVQVECSFKKRDFEKVRSALRRYVTVEGKMRFGIGQAYPVKAFVESIVIHPYDHELPTAKDLKGLLKHDGATTSEDSIRQLRNEW